MSKGHRTRAESMRDLYGGAYSVDDVAALLMRRRSAVVEMATRDEDPIPFRYLPGATRGAFVPRADLLDWLERNSVPYAARHGGRRPD